MGLGISVHRRVGPSPSLSPFSAGRLQRHDPQQLAAQMEYWAPLQFLVVGQVKCGQLSVVVDAE